jgi:hypothetical protein
LAFTLHITDADWTYLANLPLSERAKGSVDAFLDYAIAQVDDAFRNDPANRPWPNRPLFQRDFLLLDDEAAGKRGYHKIRFVVNDAAAPYGVLVLVYVDHQQV